MTDQATNKYMDSSLPVDERVDDLVSQMTLEEKISQTVHEAPAIDRLNISEYHWWGECLHGVARAGKATVFPQAIGMAASFNKELMHRAATVISDEARAKHHQAARQGNRGAYFSLTHYSPNINIFRDPRWGRGQETYGEDPYLTGQMGVAYIRGLQGDDPDYIKVVATAKHYAVHSGPEHNRHSFNAVVSKRDLYETYLPAFKACVEDGHVVSIMGAYNRTNGEPCCASKILLENILRDEWGFDGFVVSDLGAILDIHEHHKVTNSPAESAAISIATGCDLNLGEIYHSLREAVEKGLVTEEEIDIALKRLFAVRFRLGMFDPPEKVKHTRISPDVVDSEKHRDVALQMARESIVLLKNQDNLLPLKKDLCSIAVIGPHADSLRVLRGNYFGYSSRHVTLLEGIIGAVSPGTQVNFEESSNTDRYWAMKYAAEADVVIACMGYTPELEGEEGEVTEDKGGGDRSTITMPGTQRELLMGLAKIGKPIVLVLTGGSPIELNWEAENISAILMAWYPGEEGGTAVAHRQRF